MNCHFRYDNTGEYRIGPTFVTASRLYDMEKNKPGRLAVSMEPEMDTANLEFGLLTYLWTFTDQHDRQVLCIRISYWSSQPTHLVRLSPDASAD